MTASRKRSAKATGKPAARARHEERCDIVIVGGGLAGATLALTASRLGLSVSLIEAHAVDSFPEGKPERVIALSHGSRCHLERLDLWDAVVGMGVAPIRKVHVCEPGNRGEVGMHCAEADVEALGYVVHNAHILRALYAAMPKDVRVLAPAQLQSLHCEDERVTVAYRGDDGEGCLHARLLVGADGTISRVRELCGITSRGWDHNRFGVVASVTPGLPHRDVAHECFRPDGPLAFLPLDSERYSIVWTLTPREASRVMQLDDVGFMRSLEQAAGREMKVHLGGFEDVGPRALFPFEYRVAERLIAPRTALLGNAAHTMHPVAGQGLNLGLRDVAALSMALQRAVQGDRDIGAPIVLEEYVQRRWPDTLSVSAFTEGLNAVFCSDLLPVKWARGLGMSGMERLPSLRRWLLRRAAGLAQQASFGGVK